MRASVPSVRSIAFGSIALAFAWHVCTGPAWSQTESQAGEERAISRETLNCVIANGSWLLSLPDDPIEFYLDICPGNVNEKDIHTAVRLDNPDIEPKFTVLDAVTNIDSVRLGKGALRCLVEVDTSIPNVELTMLLEGGVVASLLWNGSTLDLGACELHSMDKDDVSPP